MNARIADVPAVFAQCVFARRDMKRPKKNPTATRPAVRSARDTRTPPRTPPRPSRAITTLLGASFVIPLGIILVLLAAEVRLGQGYFEYRYSPVRGLRTIRALPAVVIGAAAAGGVMLLCRRERKRRLAGGATLAIALVAAGAWSWFGPPAYANQHFFNLTSPSSDGAFVLEAREQITSLPAYLRDFPQRLNLTEREMGGTRVLSNPPLTTVFAYAVRGNVPPPPRTATTTTTPTTATTAATAATTPALAEAPDPTVPPEAATPPAPTPAPPAAPPTALERWLVTAHDVAPEHARYIAYAIRVSIVLTLLWVLSGVAAYMLGRVFLAPPGAAVFAVLLTFNPATVLFVPGKDPAQLLSINLMLWAWLLAWRRRMPLLAALGGAILTVGATAGLIHIWVALIVFAATAWDAWRSRQVTMLLVNAFAAGAGALAVISAAYFVLDWNIPHTLLAVSRRFARVQSENIYPRMNRTTWFLIGLPIFLLFLAPGIWTIAGLRLRRAARRRRRHPRQPRQPRRQGRIRFGTVLALVTVAVMCFIYIVMGVTYELPRLWVAFLPPLALGLMIDRPVLRGPGVHPRIAIALALIVFVHIAFTAMHWTLFDAREAEYRLTPREGSEAPRYYD